MLGGPPGRLAGLRAAMADEVLPDPGYSNESQEDVRADDPDDRPAALCRVGDHEETDKEPEGPGAPLATPRACDHGGLCAVRVGDDRTAHRATLRVSASPETACSSSVSALAWRTAIETGASPQPASPSVTTCGGQARTQGGLGGGAAVITLLMDAELQASRRRAPVAQPAAHANATPSPPREG
jgi:hypothetical protein